MTTTQRRKPRTQPPRKRGELQLPDPRELLLTATKAAALIGRSRWTFYRAGIDREIPCIVVGGTRMWPRRDVEAWIERHGGAAPSLEAS